MQAGDKLMEKHATQNWKNTDEDVNLERRDLKV